jgi:phosphotransferase system HPr (HPr) family protein
MMPLGQWTSRLLPGLLEIRLPDGFRIHARHAALIARVVVHHGAAVQLEVDGRRCNAGSIIQLLMTLGTSPDAQGLLFRGEDGALADLRRLFEYELGEGGIASLPHSLAYLHELDGRCGSCE